MIYIWVRATTSWDDEEAFLAQLRPALRPRIDLWNRTFSIPFHLFRHRVRQIARLNLSRVEDAVCADWDEIPEGGLVVPVDDDDWFAPDLAKLLEERYDPQAIGYYWTSSFIEIPITFRHRLGSIRRRICPWTPPKFICTTNNYAMVKSSETQPLLASHLRASEWVRTQRSAIVTPIDSRASVMNRTLASITSLAVGRPVVTASELIRKRNQYTRLYRRRTLHELPWARPYMAMMSDLMAELMVVDGDDRAGVRPV